ncbi:alanine racemase [Rhizobium sp. G21]|uniref:alanine racemase n=1 Tax=Rhizobium sp. G21 TaxID=2758439 RepID=UPI0016040905|nr:alanine racemase [Rhizobium sp. G21]MBB1248154.1 alanine racemase [Rhizobium sp. G21]
MRHDPLPPPDFTVAASRLTIDVGACVANWRDIAARSKAQTGAAVKADAYGLGVEAIAPALVRAGCKNFFVATIEEGACLRALAPDARIFSVSGLWSGQEALAISRRIIPVAASPEQLDLIAGLGGALDHALFIDTGMNRLGLAPSQASAYAQSGGEPVVVMSHLACADEADNALNARQNESFQPLAALFEEAESSLSSSAGILLGPDYHYDLTRPGIALYGGLTLAGFSPRPVATAEARIIQIRTAKAGETVSYGACEKLDRDSRIAILGAGYADGWHRAASGAGAPLRDTGLKSGGVMISGHRAPILGRITMDLTMVDVTEIPEGLVRAGDYAEFFGPNVPIEDAARAAGTISYELLTSLGKRYVRRIV